MLIYLLDGARAVTRGDVGLSPLERMAKGLDALLAEQAGPGPADAESCREPVAASVGHFLL